MNFEPAHRLDNLHVSGTRVVFSKCAELAAQNIPVTALTLGEPDFSTPQYIVDACKRSLDAGQTRYTDGSGILELKEAVCEKLARENGLHYTPAEISVTTGVAQGMFVALLSTLNPGDEVLVPDPVYLTYSEIPNIAGAVIKKYNLLEENDYQVQVDEVRSLITEKTKMLVIVSPSNPTGGVLSRASMEALADIAREHDLLVLSDEIYDRFVYDDEQELVSIASLPGMKERSIVLNGFSKSMAMTGWRLGYCMADAKLMDRIQVFHQYCVTSVPSFVQRACVTALETDTSDVVEIFRRRRDYVYQRLVDMGLDVEKPEGAFYMFVDIRKFGMDSNTFCTRMLKEGLVGVIPGIHFGTEGFMRLSYCYSDADLKEGLDRIEKFIKSL